MRIRRRVKVICAECKKPKRLVQIRLKTRPWTCKKCLDRPRGRLDHAAHFVKQYDMTITEMREQLVLARAIIYNAGRTYPRVHLALLAALVVMEKLAAGSYSLHRNPGPRGSYRRGGRQ